MPVAERRVRARIKFKEEIEMARLMPILVSALIIAVATNTAYVVLGCVPQCSVCTCTVTSDAKEKGSDVISNRAFSVTERVPDLGPTFGLDNAATWNQGNDFATPDGKLTPKVLVNGIAGDDREIADPTRTKINKKYKDTPEFIVDVPPDFTSFMDKDANMLFSEDVTFIYKAMFDSGRFISSF